MHLDLLSEYTIPYLHPLAVHFPLVLLLVAAAAAVAYLALGVPLARQAALVFLLAGAVGAWWAGETGETLEHEVEGEPMAEAVLDAHEDMAGWTLRLALLASVAAAGTSLAARRRIAPPAREPWAWRVAVALPAVAAAVLVAWTAHLGGIMVWGVPVAPAGLP